MRPKRHRPTDSAVAEPQTAKARRTRQPPVQSEHLDEYMRRYFGTKQKGGKPDCDLVAALRHAASQSAPTAECCEIVYRVIGSYGVGRVFVGLSPATTNRLARVVAHLQVRWPSLQTLTLCDRKAIAAEVDALVDVIATFNTAKPRRSPCAASKLLAVLGLPVPIWDSLARSALGVRADASYEVFHDRWVCSYEAHRADYEAAAAAKDPPATEYMCIRAHDVRLMGAGKP